MKSVRGFGAWPRERQKLKGRGLPPTIAKKPRRLEAFSSFAMTEPRTFPRRGRKEPTRQSNSRIGRALRGARGGTARVSPHPRGGWCSYTAARQERPARQKPCRRHFWGTGLTRKFPDRASGCRLIVALPSRGLASTFLCSAAPGRVGKPQWILSRCSSVKMFRSDGRRGFPGDAWGCRIPRACLSCFVGSSRQKL